MKQKSFAQAHHNVRTTAAGAAPRRAEAKASPGFAHPAQTLSRGGIVGGPQALFGLQRTVGNAVVAREVAARRTFQADVFKGDATLERVLNDQGRLKPGDSGGSVQKVQEALIRDDVPLPKFGADAIYGSETSTAVKAFKTKHQLGSTQFGDVGPGTMGKLDELNVGNNPAPPGPTPVPPGPTPVPPGPTPVPPGPNPVPPAPGPVDPALEDMLDSIWLQHQVLLDSQRDALTRLEADLTAQELPTELAIDILKTMVKSGAGALFGGVGTFLTDAIMKALAGANMSADDQELSKSGLESMFDAAKGAIESESESKVDDLTAKGEKGVDVFIDGQRAALLDASASEQDEFLITMKPKLRQPTKPKPDGTTDTPLDRAKKVRKAVKDQRTDAFNQQYSESLATFSVGQARTGLGVTNEPGKEQGTDMSKEAFDKLAAKSGSADKLRGVIELDASFDEDDATKPFVVEEATILGLSPKSRDRLSKSEMTLGDTGIPIFASDKGVFEDTELRISQNENGQRFDSGNEADALKWLAARGKQAKAISPPELFTGSDVAAGIQDVFERDINPKKIKTINGGKGLEKS